MPTTYNALKKAVQDFSGRTDQRTISKIPQFITAAQTHLDGNLRVPSMTQEKHVNVGPELSHLNRVMQLELVMIDGEVGVLMPYEEIVKRRHIADHSRAYAMVGNYIQVVQPCALDVVGWVKPARLSDTIQENAYTKEAENALLWQALSALGVFARDAKAAQSWAQLAETEINNLNAQYEKYKSGAGVGYVQNVRRF